MSDKSNGKELNKKTESLDAAIMQIEKQFGKGSIMKLGDESARLPIAAISTGSIELDIALGIGGIPRGRVIEIYGPESCLDSNTFVSYDVYDRETGKRINHKGGSIQRLYERFHQNDETGVKQGKHLRNNNVDFYVKSVNDENRVIRNKVLDVVKCGKKQVFQVTTELGQSIVCTEDHKFLTYDGYKPLKDIGIGTIVLVHNNTHYKGQAEFPGSRPTVMVKYHPYLPVKKVPDRKGFPLFGKTREYLYHRGSLSRFYYEAHLNDMSIETFRWHLNNDSKEDIDRMKFIPNGYHIHHKDEDFTNNNIENLELIDQSTHGQIHANDRQDNLRFVAVPTIIVNVEKLDVRQTYDLKCTYPYNNYIADGFIVHNSGKTTLMLHAVAEAQKAGGVAAFVDAEHALDPIYAAKLGVDVDELLVSQPDTGEEALEIVEALVRSGAIDILIIDSVAALVPKAEIDGDMGDAHMGLQARLMSQALRKLTGVIAKSKTSVVFINQIRYKIGVMFGCTSYDTLLNFTDGRSIPMGEVVDNRIEGNVWCINEDTGILEEKPIIDWHDNGKVEDNTDFIHIQTESIDGRGRFGLTCTPNHKILTDSGWKEAKDIDMEDFLISKYEETINGSYGDFMVGLLVGDSHISIRDKNTASLRLQDNENPDYLTWKLDKLKPFITFTEREGKRGFRYDSDYTYELAKVKRELGERDPLYFMSRFSNLGLAIWIMDDGSLDLKNGHRRYRISCKRLRTPLSDGVTLEKVASIFNNKGYECSIHHNDGSIGFTTTTTDKIAEAICEYVPEPMQYKLPEEYRGKYKEFGLLNTPRITSDTVSVKEIRYASDRQMRNKRKFDITVEDNHNYMVGGKYNGVVVHNSPETTTGGNALKFYSSVRMDIRRIETLKSGDEAIGNKVRVKVIKNKTAPPFRQAEFDIMYNSGISKEGGILDMGVKYEIINKAGTWYSYGEERIGQGRENSKRWLAEHPDVTAVIETAVRAESGLGDGEIPEVPEMPENTEEPANTEKAG